MKILSISYVELTGPFKLMPGSYDYGFEYLLPNSLPTSFEGKRGHIRYTVKCVIAIRIWPDEVLYEPITVIRELDLNVNPEFKVNYLIHTFFVSTFEE